MRRRKLHALNSQVVKLGRSLMEPARLVRLARKRFHRRDSGDAFLQLARKFLDHFLQVVDTPSIQMLIIAEPTKFCAIEMSEMNLETTAPEVVRSKNEYDRRCICLYSA